MQTKDKILSPRSFLNISIDDVSPHPEASIKVLDRCYELIAIYPDIKFTLFIPMAYWRTIPGHNSLNPYVVSDDLQFCDVLNNLSEKNFEICFHGLYHGIPGKSNNDEFANVTFEEAKNKLESMFAIQVAGKLSKMKKVFRPPAWRMSPDAFAACKHMGIHTLALSPKDYAQKVYAGHDKTFGRVVFYNVNPPFDPLALFPKTEVIFHSCEWDKNYLSIQQSKELEEFLSKNIEDIDFVFIESLL